MPEMIPTIVIYGEDKSVIEPIRTAMPTTQVVFRDIKKVPTPTPMDIVVPPRITAPLPVMPPTPGYVYNVWGGDVVLPTIEPKEIVMPEMIPTIVVYGEDRSVIEPIRTVFPTTQVVFRDIKKVPTPTPMDIVVPPKVTAPLPVMPPVPKKKSTWWIWLLTIAAVGGSIAIVSSKEPEMPEKITKRTVPYGKKPKLP